MLHLPGILPTGKTEWIYKVSVQLKHDVIIHTQFQNTRCYVIVWLSLRNVTTGKHVIIRELVYSCGLTYFS